MKEIADALGNDPNFATTITKKLAAITEQLNQEITNRTEADAQVQANVDKEVSDRKEADTALEAKLKEYVDNEVDKITGNTNGIQASLNKEIQDRKDADAALQAAITKEETDRKAADAALDTRVTANATKIQELALSIQDAVNTVKNELQAKIDALQTEVNTNKANIQRNTDRLNDQITKEAEDYAELKGMVNAEAEARANADTNLKSQVDKVNIDLNTEVSKREAGDTVLQQNIDKEISDRTSADTLLDNKFTGLINTESTARANEDEKINARIDQEIKDRKAGDDALSTRIDSLNSGVTGSLDELREKVTNNTTAIQTEVERAKAAEQALKDSLTTAMENHKDDLVAISKDINDEAQSRLQEDTKLQNNIDTETLNRTQADTLLENKITQEVSDRVQAVENLNDRKVDKVDGKELSSNDFTDLLKAKLDNIQEFANYITKVSQLENDSNYQNAEQVEAAIQKVIGSAPGVLDTLEEIAKALGDDPNFATTITNKLTELKGIIDKEISDRTAADEQVTQKFTELSTTLNATVSELRTFVTETRSELLTKAQAQDELIAKNTANIQRNLELIQGLQSNQNTGYLEIKELLNTEIEARKAEDIRIEAKVDKNTQDLTTERNERIAADKVLQDNIDAEEAARIAADNALGKRIDKEIEDRKAADTALENKFNGITSGLDERLQKEEATSNALPLTMVTEIDPNLVINGTSAEVNFKSSVKEEGNLYGEPMARKFAIPASTNAKAGLQTASDKKKWDSMPDNIITGASYTAKADVVTTNVNRSTYNAEEGIQKSNDFTIDIPASTSEKAGVQTAADKKLFDSVPQTIVVGEGATSNDKMVAISVNRKTVSEGVYKDDNTVFNLPVASTTKAGTMSAVDKKLLDSLPLNISINSTTIEQDSTKVVIKKGYVNKNSGVYDNNQPLYELINLSASTSEKAGVQTAADKKLFDSVPQTIVVGEGATSNDKMVAISVNRKTVSEGVYKDDNTVFNLPVASTTKAGTMSAVDKKLLDSLPLNISINSTTIEQDSTKVVIKKGYVNKNSGVYDNNQPLYELINLSASTSEKAGVQTAADKKKFDSLPDKFITNIKQGPKSIDRVILTKNTSSYSLENGVYQVRDEIADIVAATKTTAGVMSAQDKINLDETLPNAIAKEVQDRKDAIAALESSSNASIKALEKKHDDFVATKGQANGFASLDGNGLVPSSQLPSYVDDVIEVYATYDISETGKLSNIKLYSDLDHANPITGESGKIYLNITQGEPPYQFRWSGTQFVDSNTSSLILGEVTGTAYDGGKGKYLSNWRESLVDNLRFYSHIKDNEAWTRNANEVRLNFNCSNFNDPVSVNSYNEPIPAATKDLAGVQTAADKKLFDSIPGTIIISGKGVVQNTDKIWVQISKSTKADGVYGEATTQTLEILAANANRAGVLTREMFNKLNSGLNGDITNALNEAKAYTDAAKTALNKLITDEAAARQAADKVIQDNLNTHIGNISNPHKVTKAQVGLGNVQNLAPADMPVSTAQATAIANAKAAGTKAQTDLNTHANRRDNPHNVTRAQLGLATTDQVVFAKTTAASGFWKESDGRLKSQVENLNHTLDQICNIPTVHFKMNGKYQVGTIAQSLEEIEPLLVSENTIPASQVPNQSRFETFVGEDGQEYVKVKVVEYEMLSVMALEGVKLLRKEFEDFKKQLNNK